MGNEKLNRKPLPSPENWNDYRNVSEGDWCDYSFQYSKFATRLNMYRHVSNQNSIRNCLVCIFKIIFA